MKAAFFRDRGVRGTSADKEFNRLLNLIKSRLMRKEVALAEEFAAEFLDKAMDLLLYDKAARMNRLNRFLTSSMKLTLTVVCIALLLMVLNIQPLVGLKVFVSGYVMIIFLAVINYYLTRRFYHATHMMIDVYRKESRRFIALLIDCVRVNGNPETALDTLCLAVMR